MWMQIVPFYHLKEIVLSKQLIRTIFCKSCSIHYNCIYSYIYFDRMNWCFSSPSLHECVYVADVELSIVFHIGIIDWICKYLCWLNFLEASFVFKHGCNSTRNDDFFFLIITSTHTPVRCTATIEHTKIKSKQIQ